MSIKSKHQIREYKPFSNDVKDSHVEPPAKLSPAQREYSDILMRLIKNYGGNVGSRMIKKLPPPE